MLNRKKKVAQPITTFVVLSVHTIKSSQKPVGNLKKKNNVAKQQKNRFVEISVNLYSMKKVFVWPLENEVSEKKLAYYLFIYLFYKLRIGPVEMSKKKKQQNSDASLPVK